MSKDNDIVILPCVNGKFYVRNVQASENMWYEPDVVAIGQELPTYNMDWIISTFVSNQEMITADSYFAAPAKHIFNAIVASSKEEAIKVANEMCEQEEIEMGWGPEHGVNYQHYVIPFCLEFIRNLLQEKHYLFILDRGVYGMDVAIAKNEDRARILFEHSRDYTEDVDLQKHQIIEGFLYENLGDA